MTPGQRGSPRAAKIAWLLFWMVLASLLPIATAVVTNGAAAGGGPVEIQLLAVSDWRAQLDPQPAGDLGEVGGAAVLAAYFRADRALNPRTLTLGTGNGFGASPPLASFFEEEPAVWAMNALGFDADTFGNHNFNRGLDRLRWLIGQSRFRYLAANLDNLPGNLTGVAPSAIYELGGVRVAVIGLVNPDAADLVIPGAFGTIEVTDPVPAARRAIAAARADGAQVVVAIARLGVERAGAAGEPARGPLIDLASSVDGFDVILGDGPDAPFEAVVNGALVIGNRGRGQTYSRTRLTVDGRSGAVLARSNETVTPVAAAVTPDPDVVALLAPYRARLAAALDTPIGTATGVFPRDGTAERLGESALGNLVADALRWRHGTSLALVNAGGLRASLPSAYAPADGTLRRTEPGYAPGPPFDLVAGDTLAVLPFGNLVVTRNVTGRQIHAALEHSVGALPEASGRFAQISGFRFTFDPARPAGSRVLAVSLDDGTPIRADDTVYTLATNDFVNSGGDGYTMLADGQGAAREVLAEVVLGYIKDRGTVDPTIDGRITER